MRTNFDIGEHVYFLDKSNNRVLEGKIFEIHITQEKTIYTLKSCNCTYIGLTEDMMFHQLEECYKFLALIIEKLFPFIESPNKKEIQDA